MDQIKLTVDNTGSYATWLPSPEDIIRECEEHGHGPSSFEMYSSNKSEVVFVKYGYSLGMGGARTQNYLASIVNEDEEITVYEPRSALR